VIGDSKSGVATLTPSETYDIKPSGVREEWIVTNLYTTGASTFEVTDGTDSVPFWEPTGSDRLKGESFHLSSSYWIKVTNTGSTEIKIAWDGVQSR